MVWHIIKITPDAERGMYEVGLQYLYVAFPDKLVVHKKSEFLIEISAINYVAAYLLTKKVLYLFLNIFTLVEFFRSLWSLFHITGPIILRHIDFSVVLQYIFLK